MDGLSNTTGAMSQLYVLLNLKNNFCVIITELAP